VHGQVPIICVGLAGRHGLAADFREVDGLPAVEAGLAAGEGDQRADEVLLLCAGCQDAFVGGTQGFGEGAGIG
jgi:hypothetical protein